MTKRTHPTPSRGVNVSSGAHAMRRGGARREVTERVTLTGPGPGPDDTRVLEGWALNVSRGGLRAILEEKVTLGDKFDVVVGTDDVLKRPGRIVWVQEEPDGVIVGIEFTSLSGLHVSAPPPEADAIDRVEGDAGDPGKRDDDGR